MTNNIFKTIKHLYTTQTWGERYGGDIWIVIVIFVIWGALYAKLHSRNYLSELRSNWPAKRCLPYILPFAGHINSPDGSDPNKYTIDNFGYCINQILEDIIEVLLIPILLFIAIFMAALELFIELINLLRMLISYIIGIILAFIAWILALIENITIIPQRVLGVMVSIFGQVEGVLKVIINLIMSVFDITMSGIKICINAAIVIAIIFLIVYFVLAYISRVYWFCFGCPFLIPAIVLFLFVFIMCTLIILTAVILQKAMDKANDSPMPPPPQTHKTPPNPMCFSENTIITLQSNIKKKISDIQLGDILLDGGRVTATMKTSAASQKMFSLYGVIVSEKHSVKYNDKWVYINEHPDALLVCDFREPYLYCINTSTKHIIINDTCFSDWDDLDEKDEQDIITNCDFVPPHFDKTQAHYYLDSGFSPDQQIELEDGRSILLSELEVNDILKNGEKVQGIVKIDGRDLSGISVFNISNKYFESSKNIVICDTDLGNINTYYQDEVSKKYEPYLIHLLTDKNTFDIQGIKVGDYSAGIETYLPKYCENKLYK